MQLVFINRQQFRFLKGQRRRGLYGQILRFVRHALINMIAVVLIALHLGV